MMYFFYKVMKLKTQMAKGFQRLLAIQEKNTLVKQPIPPPLNSEILT